MELGRAVLDATANPFIHISTVMLVGIQAELIHGHSIAAEEEQVGGEVLELAPFLRLDIAAAPDVELPLVDVDAGSRAPEVCPPPRQHARLHKLPRRQEGQDGVEDAVRKGA